MSDMEWKWNTDAFDAIRLNTPNGEIEIVGTDDPEVLLEGDSRARHMRMGPGVQGRWLVIPAVHGSMEWTLSLPKSKAWVIEIAAGHGQVSIENVHARLAVQLGSGEVKIADCRGVFVVNGGSGEVEFENCAQAEAPAAPAFEEARGEQAAGAPPRPGNPPIPPIPPILPMGGGARRRIRLGDATEWEEYGAQWEEWGERFAEQATRWAETLADEFTGMFDTDDEPGADGLRVRMGHGDVQLQEVDVELLRVRLGSGDINVTEGRAADLALETSRGDVSVESVLPTANWEITTRHGDIQLTLPADTQARIDAATRHGDIDSDVPLVSVGRPGRAARHGGRMVGTLGAAPEGENPIEIHLESLHGDIQIELDKRRSRFGGQPPARGAAKPAAQPASDMTRAETNRPPAPSAAPASSAVVPVTVTDLPAGADAALKPPPEGRVQVYDSQLAILQALRSGEITVAEAEMLLRSLNR